MQTAMITAPDGFEEILGDLPKSTALNTRITRRRPYPSTPSGPLETSQPTLDLLTLRLPKQASVLITRPKRTAKHCVYFNQKHVRDTALAAGLVDYNVCCIDANWSALKFVHRKTDDNHHQPLNYYPSRHNQ
jgi:hypothetical protein